MPQETERFTFFQGKISIGDGGSQGVMYAGVRLHEVARDAFRNARESRAQYEARQAMIAIVFSAASVESFLRDYVDLASRMTRDEFSDDKSYQQVQSFFLLASEFDRAQREASRILKTAEIIFQGRLPDRGAEPYQSFDRLFDLRNHVLHLKPERVDSINQRRVSPVHKLVKRLESAAWIPSHPNDKGTDRSDSRLFTSCVAEHCCNAATNTVRHAAKLAPDAFGQIERDFLEDWVLV